jgi:hypothetical protein
MNAGKEKVSTELVNPKKEKTSSDKTINVEAE